MDIVIVNRSTLVADNDVDVIAECEQRSLEVFADQWDLAQPQVKAATDEQTYPPDTCLIVLLDDADQAGALGYHTTTDTGDVYAKVFVRDSIAALTDTDPATIAAPVSLDVVLSALMPVVDHEGKEALLDPDAADMVPDAAGQLWAREACDAVESDGDPTAITLADGSTVTAVLSNHVLPSYFRAGTPGPWDHSGKLEGPFTLDAGGYSIVQNDDKVEQVFGPDIAGWRRDGHEAAFAAASSPEPGVELASRTGWRCVALALRNAAKGDTVTTDQAPTVEHQHDDDEPKPEDEQPEAIAGVDADTADLSPFGTEHPEPRPVGQMVHQDNVTEPGVQHTHRVDHEGHVNRESHNPDVDVD